VGNRLLTTVSKKGQIRQTNSQAPLPYKQNYITTKNPQQNHQKIISHKRSYFLVFFKEVRCHNACVLFVPLVLSLPWGARAGRHPAYFLMTSSGTSVALRRQPNQHRWVSRAWGSSLVGGAVDGADQLYRYKKRLERAWTHARSGKRAFDSVLRARRVQARGCRAPKAEPYKVKLLGSHPLRRRLGLRARSASARRPAVGQVAGWRDAPGIERPLPPAASAGSPSNLQRGALRVQLPGQGRPLNTVSAVLLPDGRPAFSEDPFVLPSKIAGRAAETSCSPIWAGASAGKLLVSRAASRQKRRQTACQSRAKAEAKGRVQSWRQARAQPVPAEPLAAQAAPTRLHCRHQRPSLWWSYGRCSIQDLGRDHQQMEGESGLMRRAELRSPPKTPLPRSQPPFHESSRPQGNRLGPRRPWPGDGQGPGSPFDTG